MTKNLPSTIDQNIRLPRNGLFTLLALLFFYFFSQTRSEAQTLTMSSDELARAIQVSASVSALSANEATGVRDSAWLSFMVEFYKRNPNTPAISMANAYASYTNAFQRLSTVANFPNQYLNPSAPELYNLIIDAATSNFPPNLVPYVSYAAAAVEISIEAQSQANPVIQNLVSQAPSSFPFFSAFSFQTTLSRLSASFLARTNLHTVIDSSLTLADGNGQFNAAYNSIISPITLMSPGDSLSQILLKVPGLASNQTIATLTGKMTGGSLQITTNDALQLFVSESESVIGAMSNGIVQLGLKNSKPLSSEITNDFSSFTGAFAFSTTAFDLIATIAGKINPNFAQDANEIATVGQNAVTLDKAIGALLDTSTFSGDTILSSLSGVGAIMNIVGLFAGGNSGQQNANAQILKQIAAIQTQIQNLQKDMDARFNRVDSELNTIYTSMNNDFNQVVIDLNTLNANLNADSTTLIGDMFSQQTNLLAFENNVQQWLAAEFQGALENDIRDYLLAPLPPGNTPLTTATPTYYQTAEQSFFNDAGNSTQNVLTPGDSGDTAYNQLAGKPPEELVNVLNGIVGRISGGASFSGATMVNPVYWAIAANAYVQLCRDYPVYAKEFPNTITHLKYIYGLGVSDQAAFANITFTNGPGGKNGINWPLWNTLFSYYQIQLQTFTNALWTVQTNYQANLVAQVGFTNFDLIRGTNFLTAIAGTNGAAPSNPPLDTAHGTNATFNNLASIFPMADGSIEGIDYLPSVSNATCGCVVPGGFVIRNVSPIGTVTTRVTNTSPIIVTGVVITPQGATYIDYWDCPSLERPASPTCTIAVVNSDGTLTTVAGAQGLYGHRDGPTNQALFQNPSAMATEPAGDIFIVDGPWVRNLDLNNNVTTVCSNLDTSISTSALAVDDLTNFYLAQNLDSLSWQVLELSSSGGAPQLILSNQSGTVYGLAISPDGLLYVDFASPVGGSASSIYEALGDINTKVGPGALFDNWKLQVSNSSTLSPLSGPLQSPLSSLTSHQGWPGAVPLYGGICADPFNDVYGSTGSAVVKLGTGWTTNLLYLYEEELQAINGNLAVTGLPGNYGATVAGLEQNLDAAVGLITNLVLFGLSQSYYTDDLLHSALAGGNKIMDRAGAGALIGTEVAALEGNSDVTLPDPIDLAAVASDRLATLKQQVALHLLDTDSRGRAPADNLVLDVIFTSGGPIDVSPSGNSVALLGSPSIVATPSYQAHGGAPSESSLSCDGASAGFEILSIGAAIPGSLALGSNNDFSIGFWVTGTVESTFVISSSNSTWQVGVTNGVPVAILQPSGGISSSILFPTNNSSMATWNYYMFVFARHAGVVLCYVNGVATGLGVINDNGGDLGSSGASVIGQSSLATPLLINDVSIWERAVGVAEVSSLYNAGAKGIGVIPLSIGFVRNPSPTEPFSVVNYTIQELRLMSNIVASPFPQDLTLGQTAGFSTNLQLQVFGLPGAYYTLQASTDLLRWMPYLNMEESFPVSVGSTRSGNLFFRVASQ